MANQGNANNANSSSKFMSYFYKTVQPLTFSIEKIRQGYFNGFKLYLLVVICIWLLVLFFCGQFIGAGSVTKEVLLSILVGNVVFFILFVIIPLKFLNFIYSTISKRAILPVILKYWGEFSYQPAYSFIFNLYVMIKQKKDWKWFWDEFTKENQRSYISISRYVLEKVLEFAGMSYDDKIVGIFKDTGIEFSELETYFTSPKITTFNGVVFSVKLNKKFKGITAFSCTNLDKTKLAYAEHLDRKKHFEDVILEDPEFTKRFKMLSTDQIEARYIFTTAFMERFMKVAQRYNYRVKAIFIDENVHILIDTLGKNWFEFSLSKPCTNFTSYQEFLTDFTGLLSIVDTLKLSEDAVL